MVRKIAIAVLSVVWLNCFSASAQPLDEIDATRQASAGIFAWFQELQANASNLVELGERHQFIRKLKDLRKDLYDLEQNKRFFLEELSRGSLDHYQLNRAISDFNESIQTVQTQLRKVGLSLRESFREGGLEVEDILRKAISDRKGWVVRFQESISSGAPIDPTSHIQAGWEAVEGLRNASIELTKLISKLEEGT